jgi:hypothetical protein
MGFFRYGRKHHRKPTTSLTFAGVLKAESNRKRSSGKGHGEVSLKVEQLKLKLLLTKLVRKVCTLWLLMLMGKQITLWPQPKTLFDDDGNVITNIQKEDLYRILQMQGKATGKNEELQHVI